MARHQSKSKIKERFVLTLPLRYERWQRDKLDKIFITGNRLKNTLIAKYKKALEQMTATRRWKEIQKEICRIKQFYQKDLEELELLREKQKNLHKKGRRLSDEEQTELKRLQEKEKECNEALAPWYQSRHEMLKQYHMSEYDFMAVMTKIRKPYKKQIGSTVAQNIASDVWRIFAAYLFNNGEEIRFSKWSQFLSLEGKNNTNLRFSQKDMTLKVGKIVTLAVKTSRRDPYRYEEEALKRKVCYCRIIRKAYPEGWRYFVQLVLEGVPPVKAKSGDEKAFHAIGSGRVGLDIGTQTLAVCADDAVRLEELAPGAQNLQDELRRVNRAMDRSRRAMNPEMFDEKGEIIDKDKLPPSCLNRHGERAWKNSKRYLKLVRHRRYLYRKQADLRKHRHHKLANELLPLGDAFYIEEMDFRALAKRMKETKKNKKGKTISKKRFGKSIANKAPALFVSTLKQKVLNAGGSFISIDTWKAKASQYNHMTGKYTKKKLSQRVNIMPDGKKIQRDLYSAFLIQHTNDDLESFQTTELERDYPSFVTYHDMEMQKLQQIARHLPSSMGVKQIA